MADDVDSVDDDPEAVEDVEALEDVEAMLAGWRRQGGPPDHARRLAAQPTWQLWGGALLMVWLYLWLPWATLATGEVRGGLLASLAALAVGATAALAWLYYRFLERNRARASAGLEEWDRRVATGELDGLHRTGRWDPDRIMASGWDLRGRPGRVATWADASPRQFVATMTALCWLPLGVLAVAALAITDAGLVGWLTLVWTLGIGVAITVAWRGRVETIRAALALWRESHDIVRGGTSDRGQAPT